MTVPARIGSWAPAIATLVALAVLAALMVYWAMQLLAPPVTIAPSGSLVKMSGTIDTSASRQLFGNASGTPVTVARRASVDVKVSGVLASDYRAAAIISIDGQPARAYGAGEKIEDGFTVDSINNKEVVLNRDGEVIRVDVPELSNRDMAVLTSGKNDTSATSSPVPTNTARRPAANPNPRSRVRGPGARNGTGGRPALQPRRLPPSGAAAASAAAKNTTGVPQPNTPAARRPAGVGRPAGQARPAPTVNPPANGGGAQVNNGQNVQNQPATNQQPARLGNPVNSRISQPAQ